MTAAPYVFRALPHDIAPADHLWCVYGHMRDSNDARAGILEWCVSELDADAVMRRMARDPRFQNLCKRRWVDLFAEQATQQSLDNARE